MLRRIRENSGKNSKFFSLEYSINCKEREKSERKSYIEKVIGKNRYKGRRRTHTRDRMDESLWLVVVVEDQGGLFHWSCIRYRGLFGSIGVIMLRISKISTSTQPGVTLHRSRIKF